jgi:L-alanine-DL-glutamate epimerase-like enolase superfamily enzyme
MSEGRVLDALDSTIVRVVTADGLAGYGEVCPLGTRYLPAFAEGARGALREIDVVAHTSGIQSTRCGRTGWEPPRRA